MAVITITKDNFDALVLNAPGRILLDFWAPWCGPCQQLAPVIDALVEEDESITVGKVNVDEEKALARQFRVLSIPTLVVLESGRVVTTAVGYRSKEDIKKLLDM